MFKRKRKADSEFLEWKANEIERMKEHDSHFRSELLRLSLKQMRFNNELESLRSGR